MAVGVRVALGWELRSGWAIRRPLSTLMNDLDCLGDRSSADNLSEIVDPICNTVMATGPDAQVDRYPIAPENRMRIYVRRACIAHNIACIVHSSSRFRENPAEIGNCRILGASLGFAMSYSQTTGKILLLPAMRPVLLTQGSAR